MNRSLCNPYFAFVLSGSPPIARRIMENIKWISSYKVANPAVLADVRAERIIEAQSQSHLMNKYNKKMPQIAFSQEAQLNRQNIANPKLGPDM